MEVSKVETMEIFAISSNTAKSKKWTYASKFIPIDGIVEKRCSKCGAVEKYPIGKFEVILEGGSQYPDILQCGQYPLLIVSDRVIQNWKDSKFDGFEAIPISINQIVSESLEKIPVVQYYNIVVTGTCELDYEKMGIKLLEECSECGKATFSKKTWEINEFYVKRDSIEAGDIFVNHHFPRKVLVNEKVAECSYRNKHTNTKFLKEKDVLNVMARAVDLKLLFGRL